MDINGPIDVFIGYSKADTPFLEQLRKQLTAVERVGLVDAWHDGEIEVGSNREESIIKAMNDSEIIILLISADFIASEFNYEKEMKWAMALHEQKKVTVIPVILKDCTWKYAPFAKLNVLPRGGIPVTDAHWKTLDSAFKQVVEEVVKISYRLKGKPDEALATSVSSEKTIIEKKEKQGGFNLKTTLIAIGVIVVLTLIAMQFMDSEKKDKPLNDTVLTDDQTNSVEKETAAHLSKPEDTKPIKTTEPTKNKLDPPKNQTTKAIDRTPKQPASYENGIAGDRINKSEIPVTNNQNNGVEILPEPEPPAPAAKEYSIISQTMTDLRDQKKYQLARINGRWWMAENLKTNTAEGSFCPDNCAKVGRLYLFKTARVICPKGWRLPTREEWKAIGKTEIASLNLAATLSGAKYYQQLIQSGQKGYYWSSSASTSDESWAFEISSSGSFATDRRYKHMGLHCRCVLDEE